MRGGFLSTMLAAAFLSAAMVVARAETSAITDAFVQETSRDFAILHQADRLALADAENARLRRFARHDDAEQSVAYAALVAWSQAERRAAKAAALTPSIDGLGPLLYPFDAVVLPLNVDGPAANRADRALLAQLQAMSGQDFDALYASSQLAALARLEHAYVDYIKNGDDPGLRRLAVLDLPKVRKLLAEIDHL